MLTIPTPTLPTTQDPGPRGTISVQLMVTFPKAGQPSIIEFHSIDKDAKEAVSCVRGLIIIKLKIRGSIFIWR